MYKVIFFLCFTGAYMITCNAQRNSTRFPVEAKCGDFAVPLVTTKREAPRTDAGNERPCDSNEKEVVGVLPARHFKGLNARLEEMIVDNDAGIALVASGISTFGRYVSMGYHRLLADFIISKERHTVPTNINDVRSGDVRSSTAQRVKIQPLF